MTYQMTWGIYFKLTSFLAQLKAIHSFNYRVFVAPKNCVEFRFVSASPEVILNVEGYLKRLTFPKGTKD